MQASKQATTTTSAFFHKRSRCEAFMSDVKSMSFPANCQFQQDSEQLLRDLV